MLSWTITHEVIDLERSGARWFSRYNKSRYALNLNYLVTSWARAGNAHFHSVAVF